MNIDSARRSGYTILELMISLVLMATLMMVAWSILGSYRDAEQRGWNQTYQMQVIRIAREWLETDAACLMEPRVQASPSASELKLFQGNEQGFEVDVIPSVNPLAWLGEITRAGEPLTTTTDAWAAASQNTATSIDPVAIHRLRYKIVGSSTTSTTTTTGTVEEFFDLQRELVPIDRWSNASSSSAADKLLTTEDLYRVSEDDLPAATASATAGPAASIRNLLTPRFRYSDGKDWLSQWDSQLRGGLPRAIELSFDLPSVSTEYQTIEPDEDEAEEFDAVGFAVAPLAAENLVAVEATAASADGEAALTRDVRIVVLVAGSAIPGGQRE